MGIFNRSKKKEEPKRITWDDLVSIINGGDSEKNEARNLSGVYQCIELISNTISKLPFFLINDKTKKSIEDNSLYNLLNLKPNPNMNASTFKKTIITNLLTNGNAYIYPKRKPRSFDIERLEIIDDGSVSVERKDGTGDVIYTVNWSDDKSEKLRFDELIHLKVNPTKDGLLGVSPLTYARLTTSVGLKQEEFQESFYDNGGRPNGILMTDTDLSSKDTVITDSNGKQVTINLKDELKAAWRKANGGTKNAFDVAVLDNGLKYAAIPQISPEDMDFVNSKVSNIEDICRFFNVPPYKLGVGKQTYSNNEQANIEYITNTIVPLVEQIEEELTIKLLPESRTAVGDVIKCNVEAELRGDSGSRAAWYKNMQYIGAYDINEIRAHENLPAIENGDARLVGANSTPLNLIVKGQTVPNMKPNTETPKEGSDEE